MPREAINPGWGFSRYTYSPAVRHGDTVYVSGLDAVGVATAFDAPGRPAKGAVT